MAQDPTLSGFPEGGARTGEPSKFSQPKPFSPMEPTNQPRLGVYAPLDINSAPVQAAALANALGIVNRIAQPLGEKQLALEADQQQAQGALDEQTGNADPAKMAQFANYRQGVFNVRVQKGALSAMAQADQKLVTPVAQGGWRGLPLQDTTDSSGQRVPGLMSAMDDHFRQMLQPLDKDPQAARILAPMIQHYMNEQLGAAGVKQVERDQAEAFDTQKALAMHQARANDGSWDVQQVYKNLAAVAGSPKEARDALASVVSQAAVESNDPSLISKLAPENTNFGNGAGWAPENVAMFDSAEREAAARQKAANANTSAANNFTTYSGMEADIEQGKRFYSQPELAKYVQMGKDNGGLSDDQANSLWTKQLEKAVQRQQDTFWDGAISSGYNLQQFYGRPIGTNKDGQPVYASQEGAQEAIDRRVAQADPDKQTQVAFQYAKQYGIPATNVKAIANTSRLDTADGVQRAVDMFKSFSDDDYVRGLFFSDPQVREQVGAAVHMVQDQHMSTQDVADYFKDTDPDQARQRANSTVVPKINSLFLTGQAPTKVNGVDITTLANGGDFLAQAQQRAVDIGRYGVNVDSEAAVKKAVAATLDGVEVLNLGTHSIAVPKYPGLDAAGAQAALQHLYDGRLAELLKAHHPEDDPDAVSFIPRPDNPRQLDLINTQTGTHYGVSIDLDAAVGMYKEVNHKAMVDEVNRRAAEAAEDAKTTWERFNSNLAEARRNEY